LRQVPDEPKPSELTWAGMGWDWIIQNECEHVWEFPTHLMNRNSSP